MGYAEDSARYRDMQWRAREEMCAREQAYVFTADGRPDIAQLAHGVIAGEMKDLDAVIAAVATAPGNEDLDSDEGLLGATQSVWPTVAAARYPQG